MIDVALLHTPLQQSHIHAWARWLGSQAEVAGVN
jgi:hypothetical protein